MMLDSLHKHADTLVADLALMWTELGLRPKQEQQRIDMILSLYDELTEHCITTERDAKDKMVRYRDFRRQQVDDMLQALHLDPFQPDTNVPLLDEAKQLKLKYDELKKVKEERDDHLQKLLRERNNLCEILDEQPKELKLETNIPSEAEIVDLQSYVSDLTKTRNVRFNKFMSMKKSTAELAAEIEFEAKSDFDRKALLEPEKKFILSEANLKKVYDLHQSLKTKIDENTEKKNKIVERLQYLWTQLDMADEGSAILKKYPGISDRIISKLSETELTKFETMRKERMADFIVKVREEVHDWWETCCFDEERIEKFKNSLIELEVDSEDVLNKWEEQLNMLKEFHADHRAIFDGLDLWRSCWEEFEVIENNEKDPLRYKNRRIPSTQIMKEQQQKRQLERKIAKLEEQLTTACQDLKTQGKPFYVYTTLLSEYVEGKRMDHEEMKENEKAMKKKEKNQKTVNESKGMVRAQYRGGNVVPRAQATPTKRSAIHSSSRDNNCEVSPSKTRRVNISSSKLTTPMAPPVLTRQNTITKSSSSFKPASLATRGRSASQMSIMSVKDEEDFQVHLSKHLAAAGPSRALNSTTTTATTPLKDFYNPQDTFVTQRVRKDLASAFGSKRKSKSTTDLPAEIRALTIQSPGFVSSPCSPAKRMPRLRKPDVRRPFR